jgi:Na+/proline symporter
MVAIAVFVLIGFSTVFFVKSKPENYFVGGRSLPLWVITATLASQSLDSNAILGNVDLSYKYHFYDGAVLPIGLGLSLILNGVFLARHINNDGALTLPDVFARRYGKLVELLVSLCTIISFLCLLAGNLVGMGAIISYVVGIPQTGAIWISAVLVLLYTIAGGLFSVAYTDVVQAAVGWVGCVSLAFYMIRNSEDSAPPPSIGYPGYSYPDEETCAMYDGVPCTNLEDACCYNADKWCTDPSDAATCSRIDNGAYPIGDLPVIPAAMTDPSGLTPFPNAIVWNWATIFILGFGNLAALDFQARCMASKTPKIATIGCLLAGCLTFFVGIPFAYLGAITRTFYGPDTARASFVTDTCSAILALPTCALWEPDSQAFIKLLTHEAPAFLGAWCLVGIVAASMSTCDGAILAMGTVFSHNIIRNMPSFFPCFSKIVTNDNLLFFARFASIPLTLIATLVAGYYRSTHSAGATGYLLIVAFDVVFATCVVPLFGCFYTKKPSPLAALLSIISGALVRVILEFALPKDGFLLAPFGGDEFLNFGPGASTAVPSFWDFPEADRWDPSAEPCDQSRFKDLTGVDSLAAPVVGLIVFMAVQFLERNGPLVDFSKEGNMIPYVKEGQEGHADETVRVGETLNEKPDAFQEEAVSE